jgi:hypothetical protein
MLTRLGAAPILCAVVIATSAAQSPSDAARCRTVLTRATKDSVSVRIGLSITPFDTTAVISADYRALFVQALRQALTLPRPLPLELYGFYTPTNDQGRVNGSSTVVPTIAGSYRATLKRDGHFTNTRVVGGARTRAFDDALLAAVRAVGDSQSAPPLPEDFKSADSVDVRISVRLPDIPRSPGAIGLPPALPYDPLFIIRVPSFGFPSQTSRPLPNNPAPLFPFDARRAHLDGRVIAEFVVDASGTPDLSSVQIVQATAVPFVAAVLDVLPQHRFSPLAIDGCPVASIVMQPFEFHIVR